MPALPGDSIGGEKVNFRYNIPTNSMRPPFYEVGAQVGAGLLFLANLAFKDLCAYLRAEAEKRVWLRSCGMG